jgi:DNA mismatch repair protein MutH
MKDQLLKPNSLPKPPLTKEEIQRIGRQIIGKKIKEILGFIPEDDINNKGQLGQLIEEYVFGQKPHNDSNPDFIDAGVELKLTPFKKLKNGDYSSKERLVLNKIDYINENVECFEESSFWKKNRQLYILFYEYIKDLPKSEYVLYKDLMMQLSQEDLKQIRDDWNKITDKIKKGLAHEISESDTLYLSASTKGAKGTDKVFQRLNGPKAKPRAYAFKSSFMTTQLRKLFNENLTSITQGSNLTLEEYIDQKTKRFIGLSKNEIASQLNIDIRSKSSNSLLINAMLGYKGKKLNNAEEFLKGNIKFKTVVLGPKNSLKESMSFENFSFEDIVLETWEDSDLRDMFLQTKFAFCLFKGDKVNPIFKGIKFWSMTESVIDKEIKKVWDKTVQVLKEGNVYKLPTGNKSNFPKASENDICHVRPKGKNAKDVYKLPVVDKLTGKNYYTKQCFWLNRQFIQDKIIELFNL